MLKSCLIALALFASEALPALAQTAPAPASTPDTNWHYAVTPYIWLPNVNGTLGFQRPNVGPNPPGNLNIGVQVGPSSYLSNLNFAFAFGFEARKENLSVFGDYINLNLSSAVSNVRTISGPGGLVEIPISSSVNSHLFTGVFTLGLGWTVASTDTSNLDVGVGVRNVNVRASADYSITGPVTQVPLAGSLGSSETLTDATFDVRGRVGLGGRWYVPYYGDIGTGNSNTTWQYLVAVGYGGRTNDVIFGYRNLGYNQNNGQLLQNIRMGGPILGLRIHW